MTVELDLDRLEYRARLSERFLRCRPDLDELGGTFSVWGGHVFTVLCLT